MTVYLLRPEGTFLHGTAYFRVFCVKIRASVIGRTQKNEQDSRVILVVRMRRNETYPLSSTDLDNILQPGMHPHVIIYATLILVTIG